MKKIISMLLSFAMIISLFSVVDFSAFAVSEKYLVDMIASGEAIVSDPDNYTAYQCDSAVGEGRTPEGTVHIGDGTESGYTEYSKGFRYHAASGGISRNISFTMPEGYNTLTGVAGVCMHVPGVESGRDPFYCEECYVAITVNSHPTYKSGAIKVKTGYQFTVRAKPGSNVILSVVNPTTNGYYNHIIFGDPKLTYEEYPDIEIGFDKDIYRSGETITASLIGTASPDSYSLEWSLDDEPLENNGLTYTIKPEDMGKSLKLSAYDKNGALICTSERFLSKLTVVAIQTETGKDVTSKTDYIDADFKVVGNEQYDNKVMYDGLTEIRGRGNTSWGFPKKSYKLKLDKKTDLFGFGKNKHWALVACYWDENFLRNKMSYDLGGEMGLNYAASEWVDVYLNGQYHGVYILVEHTRVDESRVDIYDWEGTAEDAAEAIYEANSDKISDDGDFADYMNENMQWITSDRVTYEGHTYRVSNYYTDELPSINGGYLLELDTHEDEVSNVKTNSQLNINIKNPEFCKTNMEMLAFVDEYLQAVEDACISPDYTTTYKGQKVRYTDLCDLDSMVKWWMVNEVFFNWDAGYNSNYMYKDIDGKLMFGPVWDMDITAGGYGTSYLYDRWQTWFYKRNPQMNLWFKEAVADPVFLSYAHEIYWQYRDNFEYMIAEDGYMAKSYELLQESGRRNSALWGKVLAVYDDDYEIMLNWMKNRLNWLDKQFATEESLIASMASQTSAEGVTSYSSIQAYENSSKMQLLVSTESGTELNNDNSKAGAKYLVKMPDKIENGVSITDSNIVKVIREINGAAAETVNVSGGYAVFSDIEEKDLRREDGQKSVVLYTGYNSSGVVVGKTYATFDIIPCSCIETNTRLENFKLPKCTEEGYSGDEVCVICGKIVITGEPIPATGHKNATFVKETASTCSKAGTKAHYHCDVCNKNFFEVGVEAVAVPDQELKIALNPANHSGTVVSDGKAVKATFKVNGKTAGTKYSCCGVAVAAGKTVYKVSSVKLSTSSYTYDGKKKTPSVYVKDSKGNKLKKDTDYTVKFSSSKRKAVGRYKVTIKLKGKYSGTKYLYFTIVPKNIKLKSVKAGSKSLTVKWTKTSSHVKGYEIQYSTSSKFTKKTTKTVKVTSYKSSSKTIKKLKAKKKYYVRIRAYKTVSGKPYYSKSWSSKKIATTKK